MCHIRRAEAENCLPKLIDVLGNGDIRAANDGGAHDPGNAKAVSSSSAFSSGNYHSDHGAHSQMCALPLTQFHERAESSRVAAKLFEQLLDRYDHTNRLYQWLLNFCYMTIDAFPRDVPERYLIQTRFIDSFYGEHKKEIEKQYSYLMFEDRARELGVDTFNTGRGVAVEDFD